MIATLKGIVSDKQASEVVIDVSGVGYGVYVTSEDYSQLAINETVKLFIYEYVREQAHDLFGFVSRDTQNLFRLLLDVNGIGPKMALNVLSVSASSNVRSAIASGDVAFIQQANGVGKRVAERIVVELKDKVGLEAIDLQSTDILKQNNLLTKDEAAQALIALGFSAADANLALKTIDSSLPTEERIKQALQGSAI